MMALFMVSCRDPGLMERVTDEEAGQGGWYWNEQVGSFRPPGALYCRECGVSARQFKCIMPILYPSLTTHNLSPQIGPCGGL
jgi:hypothetical protein